MLKVFSWFVVRNRKMIIAGALVLAVFGLYGTLNYRVNYDMLSYLPQELASVKGMKILNEAFKMGTTIQIMVEGMTEAQVENIKQKIEKLDGIEKVSWVTDYADMTVPREFWDQEIVDTFYSGDSTLLQVDFSGGENDAATELAYLAIREMFEGKKALIAGSLAMSQDLKKVMNSDSAKYGIAALTLVSLVLFLTIPSIIIPILFVVTIGLAVLYNLGLAYYLNLELSYLTGVITSSLQFAVTMDYALFLYHRFEEERLLRSDDEAMAESIAATFKAVSAACLTTVAGFLALVVMRLGFGADMGLNLARGVFITLLSVVIILPALLLIFDPLIKKVAHRTYLPKFKTTAGFVTQYKKILLAGFFLLFIPAVYGYTNMKTSYDFMKGLPEDLPSKKAADALAEKFDKQESVYLIYENPVDMAGIDRQIRAIEKLEGVSGIFGYTKLVDPLFPNEFIPDEAKEQFFKSKYTYYTIDLKYASSDPRSDVLLAKINKLTSGYNHKTYLTGETPMVKDLGRVSGEDVSRVNNISLLAIFVILLIFFRSISLPLILIAAIELAILFNQAISTFTGREVIFIAALAIGAIQLGSTVDYAILITTRYEEELKKTGEKIEAVKKAIAESAQPILVSSGTMFAATIGIVFLSNVGMISGLTALISRGALISFFVVVFFVPVLLISFQPLIKRTSLGWPGEVK